MATEADFTQKELKEIRFQFNTFDADKNGSISTKEMKTVLERIGESYTEADINKMIAEYDSNNNGQIEWNEFLGIIKNIRQGKGSGLAGAVQKAQTVVATASGASTHSYTEEERDAFVDHINSVLRDDPSLTQVMPLEGDALFEAVKDGVLVCKLINSAVPGTIDDRVINVKQKKNPWEISENNTLALQSAKAIGCNIVNIGPNDIAEGRPHLILGLVWQIIKIGLLSNITLVDHPELVRLLKEGEDPSILLKMSPEELLLRWCNYQLAQAGSQKRINNLSNDIKDSEAYTIILKQIAPNGECNLEPLQESDMQERAEKMLQNADKIGCRKFISPKDVVAGNPKLNLAFVANLFNTYPALDPVDEADYAGLLEFDAEGSREERAFRFWIQSLGIDCTNLFEECRDGLLLLKVEDAVEPGIVDWKRVNKDPKHKMKKIENCNMAVDVGHKMKFSLVNIGGTDIMDGNKKLILAITWQLMRANILKMLKKLSEGGRDVTDADIVAWANNKVSGAGKFSRMESFRDASLKSGVFLCDLCAAVAPNSVNTDMITPGESEADAELNAKYAISVARKIGATLFLLPEDILEVKPKMIMTFVAGLMIADRERNAQ